jgi:hypothetical protein
MMHHELDPMRNDGAPTLEFMTRKRIKKSKKPHKCNACGEPIPTGSACYTEVIMTTDDDKPFRTYSCEVC